MGVVCTTENHVARRATESSLEPPRKELQVFCSANCDVVPFTAADYKLVCQSLREASRVDTGGAAVRNTDTLRRRCGLSDQQSDLDELVFHVVTNVGDEGLLAHKVSQPYVELPFSSLDSLLSRLVKRFPRYFAPTTGVNEFCRSSCGDAFVSLSERAETGGFSSTEEFQRVAKNASQVLSVVLQPYLCVLTETVATYRKGNRKRKGDDSDGDLAAAVVASLEANFNSDSRLRARCCGGLLKLLFLAGGGSESVCADDRAAGRCEDVLLAELLHVDTINTVLCSLTRAVGFDGFKGMHSAAELQEWVRTLHDSFRWMGVVAGVDTDSGPLHQWWPGFVEQLPLHVLSVSAKQTVLYLHCCVMGQQKLVLPAVLRSDALSSVSTLLTSRGLGNMEGQSFRLFPVFATEGVGIESGEGHGPRKELFDLCAAECFALRSAPIDISSSVSLQMVSSMKEVPMQRMAAGSRVPNSFTGKPVLLLSWKQNKIVSRFTQGDVMLVTLERKRNSATAAGGDVSHELSPSVRNECWTVEGTVDSSSTTESIVVLSTTSARIPFEFRVSSCKVEAKRTPPFRLDSGNQYCWLNPSLSCGPPSSALMFCIGFLLANSVANGVCFAAPLPPLLFRYLRHRLVHADEEYAVHPSDLALLNTALVDAVKQVEGMCESEWRSLADAEGLPPTASTKEYVESLAKEFVFNVEDASKSRELLDMLVRGFATSPAATCPVTALSSSRQLRAVFCGTVDDGTGDFSFEEQFRFVEEADTLRFPYSRRFREIVTRVFEHELDPPHKRLLLKFITGRTLLPSHPKAEHLKIEFPFAPMTAFEFDKSLERLPSSHTCDNVIELVNTLESLLFASKSAFYSRSGTRVGAVVLDSHKESAWSLFSAEEQQALSDESQRLFRVKLTAAITLSGTYELDEGAVSKAVRDAFDEVHVGHHQFPTPPLGQRAPVAAESPPTRGANGRAEEQQTPAEASSKPFAVVQRASMLYDEFEEPTELVLPYAQPRDGSAGGVLFKPALHGVASGERLRAGDNPLSAHSRGHAALGIFATKDVDDDLVPSNVVGAEDRGKKSTTTRTEDLDELMTELFPAK